MGGCSVQMTGTSALIWKVVDIVAPSKLDEFFNILKKYVTIGKLARIEIIFSMISTLGNLKNIHMKLYHFRNSFYMWLMQCFYK